MTEAEREKLVLEGATIQGTVMHNEPSAADRSCHWRLPYPHVSLSVNDQSPLAWTPR